MWKRLIVPAIESPSRIANGCVSSASCRSSRSRWPSRGEELRRPQRLERAEEVAVRVVERGELLAVLRPHRPDHRRAASRSGGKLLEDPARVERLAQVRPAVDADEVARARIHGQPCLDGEVAIVALDQLVHLGEAPVRRRARARPLRTRPDPRRPRRVSARPLRAGARAARRRPRSRAAGASTPSARRAPARLIRGRDGSCGTAGGAASRAPGSTRDPPRAAARSRRSCGVSGRVAPWPMISCNVLGSTLGEGTVTPAWRRSRDRSRTSSSTPSSEARRRLALAQIRQYPDAALKMAARPVEDFDDDLVGSSTG